MSAASSSDSGDDVPPLICACPTTDNTCSRWSTDVDCPVRRMASNTSAGWSCASLTPAFISSPARRASTVPLRSACKSAPREACALITFRALAASFSSNAVARSSDALLSPRPSSSRASASVIETSSSVCLTAALETASCSSTFSASRRLPHAARAIMYSTAGSHSISSAPHTSASRSTTSSLLSRRKSKRWQRLIIVKGIVWTSVVARIRTVLGGGSSSVFNNALKAGKVIMWTSSMMYTFQRPAAGSKRTLSRRFRTSFMPLFEAASISIRSNILSWLTATQFSQVSSGSPSDGLRQFRALANMRAEDVLPTPRGPVKR